MKCPNCGGKMRVVESFPHYEKSLVYRTRECYDCKDRYATKEVICQYAPGQDWTHYFALPTFDEQEPL